MSKSTPILLERDNVNDEFVVLSQWFVKNGGRVDEGTLIAEIETSKANVEVVAPRAGYLKWGAAEKADIDYSAPLGHIFDDPQSIEEQTVEVGTQAKLAVPAKAESEPVAATSSLNGHMNGKMPQMASGEPASNGFVFPATEYVKRFSPRALELMQQNNLTKEQFSDLSVVRSDDVLSLLQTGSISRGRKYRPTSPIAAANHSAEKPAVVSLPRMPHTEVPLSRMKRSEIQALGAGTRNAIPSAVSVTCLTRGLRTALQANPIVAGNVGAVVMYEVGRLLRKYPAFNSTYRPNSMMQYEHVNVGFAMDDGRGLKVAVVEDCDQKSLADISAELRQLVLAYLENKLSPAQVSGGTFTISDLSGMGVSGFLPLISEDQGAILGVGGEQFLPGNRDGCYTLTLAFDHQLSEGRTAALFLNDLRDRLMHYEQAMSASMTAAIACARCGRTAAELPDGKSFMVQSIVPPGYLCNLCVAGF